MRTLFPSLPPEVRNSIYDYLSTHDSTFASTTTSLPLQLRSYSCKHSLVQICPTHSGPSNLLALQRYNYLEGHEYRTWLLNHAITLRVGVVFKGRANTFVQEHWDKKVEAHLHKLAKQHPWLRKVAKYEIQILWDAPDGVLKSKHNRRNAGQIPRAMVRTLTGLMDGDVKKKRGDVTAKLRLEHHVAGVAIRSAPRFGLGSFMTLSMSDLECRSQTTEVWKEPCPRTLPRKSARLTPVVKHEEKELLTFEKDKGRLEWVDRGQGTLVMIDTAALGQRRSATFMDTGVAYDSPTELMLFELLEDCCGRR